jgi:hypothetical protein
MGLITHIVIYQTVMKPVREAKAQFWAVAPLMMMMMMMKHAFFPVMKGIQNTNIYSAL